MWAGAAGTWGTGGNEDETRPGGRLGPVLTSLPPSDMAPISKAPTPGVFLTMGPKEPFRKFTAGPSQPEVRLASQE